MISLINAFCKITGFPIQWICFRTKVYYENKKAQSRHIKKSAIIISNHTSVYDYAVFMFVFFTRNLRYQMAEILFKKNKVLKWLLTKLGGIFVDRNNYNFSFIKKSSDILNKSGVVGVFPEGRLAKDNETKPLEFKPSATYLALETGAPIIPVYTDGNYFKLKSRARVIIGSPIYVNELWDDSEDEKTNIDRITKILRDKVISLKKLLEQQRKKKIFSFKYFIFDFTKLTGFFAPLIIWRPKRIYENKNAKKILKGPAVIMSNHSSYLDPISIQFAFWYRRYHIVTSVNVLNHTPFIKKILTIPVDRTKINIQTFRDIRNALNESSVVAIFPEGQLNFTKERLLPFKQGIIEISLINKVPIIPIYVKRTAHWYSRVVIAIGEPIRFSDTLIANKITRELLTQQLYLKELELSKLVEKD